jgi:hypothetical protein
LSLVSQEGYLPMAWYQAAAADDPGQLIAAVARQEPDPRRADQTPRMKAG